MFSKLNSTKNSGATARHPFRIPVLLAGVWFSFSVDGVQARLMMHTQSVEHGVKLFIDGSEYHGSGIYWYDKNDNRIQRKSDIMKRIRAFKSIKSSLLGKGQVFVTVNRKSTTLKEEYSLDKIAKKIAKVKSKPSQVLSQVLDLLELRKKITKFAADKNMSLEEFQETVSEVLDDLFWEEWEQCDKEDIIVRLSLDESKKLWARLHAPKLRENLEVWSKRNLKGSWKVRTVTKGNFPDGEWGLRNPDGDILKSAKTLRDLQSYFDKKKRQKKASYYHELFMNREFGDLSDITEVPEADSEAEESSESSSVESVGFMRIHKFKNKHGSKDDSSNDESD